MVNRLFESIQTNEETNKQIQNNFALSLILNQLEQNRNNPNILIGLVLSFAFPYTAFNADLLKIDCFLIHLYYFIAAFLFL